MAAITKRLFHLRPHHHHPNPYPLHHFSSSSSNDSSFPSPIPQSNPNSPNPNPNPNSATYFDDVKSSLRQSPPPHRPLTFRNRITQSPPPPTNAASLEEIRRNLSEFRQRTSPPPSSTVSMEELYNRNVSPSSKPGLDSIRESLRNLKSNPDKPSLSQYKETLKMKPIINPKPQPGIPWTFGRDGSGFLGMPTHQELGKKLKMLRPEKKKGNWFSLTELNERLIKIREMEENERSGRDGFSRELREGILRLSEANAEKTREEKARKDSCECCFSVKIHAFDDLFVKRFHLCFVRCDIGILVFYSFSSWEYESYVQKSWVFQDEFMFLVL